MASGYGTGLQSVAHRSLVSISPGSLLEVQSLRPTQSESTFSQPDAGVVCMHVEVSEAPGTIGGFVPESTLAFFRPHILVWALKA